VYGASGEQIPLVTSSKSDFYFIFSIRRILPHSPVRIIDCQSADIVFLTLISQFNKKVSLENMSRNSLHNIHRKLQEILIGP